MVALVGFDLNPLCGAQQHQRERPDGSDVLDNISATFNNRNISSAQHVHGQHELIGENSSSTSGMQKLHEKHFVWVVALRVRLLGLINYILRNFPQFLKLRLLAAEAARILYLPGPDAASALLTTSLSLVVVSRASVARSQVEPRAVECPLTTSTAETQNGQPHVKQPRLRGKRGSGACRK